MQITKNRIDISANAVLFYCRGSVRVLAVVALVLLIAALLLVLVLVLILVILILIAHFLQLLFSVYSIYGN